MGLFDESESDEDTAKAKIGHASLNVHDRVEEEEEDALDAYMKSLEASTDIMPSLPKNNATFGGGRLDVGAEDEATSHWEVARPSSNDDVGVTEKESNSLLDKFDARKLPVSEATTSAASTPWEKTLAAQEAHTFMSTTFVPAGGKMGDPGKNFFATGHEHDEDNDHGYDTDDDMKDVAKRQKEKEEQQQLHMLHQEVDPLDRINHDTIRYDAFERVFYHPFNTPAGHVWRKEHDVVCTPSTFDPILGFGELGGDGGASGVSSGDRKSSTAVFPEELLRAIAQSGYDTPTLVQAQTLAVALSGKDALITVRITV